MSFRLRLLAAGSCTHLECLVVRGGALRNLRLPAGFAFLDHPVLGPTLFDTGYSSRFLAETGRFPASLHAFVTRSAVGPSETARSQLSAFGVAADDVRHVIVSHFHSDHVAGLADFPKARYLCALDEFRSSRRKRGAARLLAAFLPGLIPEDFEERASPLDWTAAKPLPPELAPFERGLDLAGDGTLLAVELPGHTAGHLGLFVAGPGPAWTLLAGDACWLARGFRENRMPHPLVRPIFADWSAARETVRRLHELHERRPELLIVPSHCAESLAAARAAWEPPAPAAHPAA